MKLYWKDIFNPGCLIGGSSFLTSVPLTRAYGRDHRGKEKLIPRLEQMMWTHVFVYLCTLGTSVHVLCAHACMHVRAESRVREPRRLNLKAGRTSLFHLSQMFVRSLYHLRPSWSSHTLSKHDTSRAFNGQWRAPARLKKNFDLDLLQVPTTVLQTSKASWDSVMC